MDERQRQRADFGTALERALDGRTRGWLGAEVARIVGRNSPITQSAVTQWIDGKTDPDREFVFAAERALKLRPGTLSRCLGYLPVEAKPAKSVVEAIDADPKLSEDNRRILKVVYATVVAGR